MKIPKRNKTMPYVRTYEDGYNKGLRKGFDEGLAQALPSLIQLAYAAAILALKREFDFDDDTCERYLLKFVDILTNEIDSQEAADKVFKEMNIKILIGDPLEPFEHLEEEV